MEMSGYNSFYGGRRGASFVIVKKFASISDMVALTMEKYLDVDMNIIMKWVEQFIWVKLLGQQVIHLTLN